MANSTADTPDVSETKLAKMRIKDLREHARERGIDGADDMHKPELLLMVKDWHYARAHGGQHRPDAPAAARNGRSAGKSDSKAEARKTEAKKKKKADAEKKAEAEKKAGDAKKADRKKVAAKADSKKAEVKAAAKKSGSTSGSTRSGKGRDDAHRTVAAIRRRLTQVEDALDDLEAGLR